MGASRWHHFVKYQQDPSAAYEELRQAVFERIALPFQKPATIEELMDIEFIEEEGTHSPLDLRRVVGVIGDEDDDEGVVRKLSDEEVLELFGTSTPTREIFERAYRETARSELPPILSGSGCYTTIYDADGEASEIAFWGKTGA